MTGYRDSSHISRWREIVRVARLHPIATKVYEDPLTKRCFDQPRGYPGDAELMDILYKRTMPDLVDCSKEQKEMFSWTISCAAPVAVRERRVRIAAEIDKTASEKSDAAILSVACGHFREIEFTEGTKQCRFFLLDQDRNSLAIATENYASHFSIVPIPMSLEEFSEGRPLYGKFDFIYSAGLFDYLDQSTAKKAVVNLYQNLNQNGRLLVANFSEKQLDAAYMECFMNWWLQYRDEKDMRGLAAEIDDECLVNLDTDESGNMRYLEIRKP